MTMNNGWIVGEGRWAGKWVHPNGNPDCGVCHGRGCVDTDGADGSFAATCSCVTPGEPGERPVQTQTQPVVESESGEPKQLDLFK